LSRKNKILAWLCAATLLLLVALTVPLQATGGKVLADWLIVYLYQDIKGSATPALSNAGEARIYFDSGTNKLKASMNGAAYADLGGGGAPGGLDTYVQFNDGGVFGGDAGMVYNKTTDSLGAVQYRFGTLAAPYGITTPTVTATGGMAVYGPTLPSDGTVNSLGSHTVVEPSGVIKKIHSTSTAVLVSIERASGVITVTTDIAHGLHPNDTVRFVGTTMATSGAFPTTGWYVISTPTATTFTLNSPGPDEVATVLGSLSGIETVTLKPISTSTAPNINRDSVAAGGVALYASGATGYIEALSTRQAASGNAGGSITLAAGAGVAGNTNVGGAQGGSVSLTAGNATRLTSGNALGGSVNLSAGNAVGNQTGGSIGFNAGTGGSDAGAGGVVTMKIGTPGAGSTTYGYVGITKDSNQILRIGDSTLAAFSATSTIGPDVIFRTRDGNGGSNAGGNIILFPGTRAAAPGLPGTVQCPSPTSPASTVIGAGAYALSANGYDVVIGDGAYTSGKYNVIIGYGSYGNTNTDSVVTLGYQAISLGASTVAIGASANIGSGGNNTVAVGTSTSASTDAVAIGKGATASAQYAVAVGGSISTDIAEATILGSIAIGAGADAKTGNYATAIGYNASTTGVNAIAIGQGTTNTGEEAITIGKGSQATTKGSVAIGSDMYSDAQYAAVIGGPLMVHKTGSASADAATTIKFFSGAETIISTEAVSLTATIDGTANVRTITIPSGTSFYVDEVGVILCEATVITQPTVQFGVTGTLDKFYGPAITTNLTALRKREKVVVTAGGDGETSLVATMTVQGSGTGKIRFYFKGILVRDE
jgi:hypothetical protein